MEDRIERIRDSERRSHTEIYESEKLYCTNSWLSKPINTVKEIVPIFSDYTSFRALDLGAGIGRNSIFIAKEFKDKACSIDCVDLLEIAIDKLDQNAVEHGVEKSINGIVKAIEDYEILPDTYDLTMVISALENSDSEGSFIRILKQICAGTKDNGVVCLVINSEVNEVNAATGEALDPQFEVNLPAAEIDNILDRIFQDWKVIKRTVVDQEYVIPRDDIQSRLTTKVITFVAQKGDRRCQRKKSQ